MFVMADNFVFQNPAHRKAPKRYTYQYIVQNEYSD